MKLNRTPNPLDRNARNGENDNWDIIEGEIQTIGGIVDNFIDETSEAALEKVIENAKLDWSKMVDKKTDLPENVKKGTTIGVKEDSKVYRFNGTDWVDIYEINLNPISEVDSRLSSQLADKLDIEEYEKSIYEEGYEIKSYFDEESNTKYWLTEIITNKDTPIKFGYSDPYETVREYAYKNNTTLSINSSLGSSTIMIVDREIIGDDVPANYDSLGITSDNELITIPQGLTPSEILDQYPNVVSVHGGFQPLYENNQKINTDRFSHFKNKHPRNVVGVRENGNIFFMTTGGRGIDGDGMDIDDIFRVLESVDYVYLYMLDGGGSNSLVEKGVLINSPMDSGGERKLPGTINLMKGGNESKSAYEVIGLTRFIGENKKNIDEIFKPRTTNDVNNIIRNGFYWAGWRASGAPKPNKEGSETSSWLLLHMNQYDKDRMQIAFEYGGNYNISIRRTNSDGNWGKWNHSKDFVDYRYDIQTVSNINDINISGHYWVPPRTEGVPEGIDTNSWYLEHIQISENSKMQLIYPYALGDVGVNVLRRRAVTSGGVFSHWTQWK